MGHFAEVQKGEGHLFPCESLERSAPVVASVVALEQLVVHDHSHHAQHSSQYDPNTALLDSTAVASEPLPGLMLLFDSGQYMLWMFRG